MCRAYPHTFFISFLFFELLCEFHLFVFGLKCAVRFFAAENNKLKIMKKKFILTVAFLSISLFAQQMWAMPFYPVRDKKENVKTDASSAKVETWEFYSTVETPSSEELAALVSNHKLGKKVAFLYDSFKDTYVVKEEVVPGDPTRRTVIRKPEIYNAVRTIEKELNRQVRKDLLPQDKAEGDPVVSGTVNLTGVITVQTQSAYGESTAAKILELVENAADQKARVESFITRFAHWYTPCVVIGAALLAVIPPLFFSQPWGTWVERALVFLVVSCPCALVVSVPLTFFGGIGGASRCGILVKGAGYMETLAKAKTVVFDKTGTLTKGSFTVTHIVPAAGTEDDLLATAAAAESFSHHPIAQSVVAAYGKPIEKEIEDAKDHTGRGIEAVIDGRHIYAGNERLMKEIGVPCREVAEVGTVIHMAADNDYLGYLVIADTPKPDSAEAIRTLKAEGVEKTVMLTGDKTAVAQAVAGELGLDEYRAELLPADKVTAVEELLQTGSPLVFVGDGINDAPVLARADVGVAMGALGSDAAIEAADIVLMDDAPSKLALAVRLSRRTMKIVWQNVIFALAVKALVLVLGATGDANMWIAVFADVGVLVLAILNAMRALLVPKH